MKRILVLLAVAFALVLLAGACGGGDDDESSSDETEASDEAADDGEDSDAAAAGDAGAGEEIYSGTCASCHGADAEGIDGVGKPLADSEYVAETSTDDLIVVVTDGRAVDDPDNTTGIAMPPKGGNPALTDEDIENVVAYIKSLN